MKDCCSKRTKERSAEELSLLLNRLKRIEGQVRGVRGMLEENAYCVDILVQVSAISSALSAFSEELLESHIRECAVKDLKDGREGAVDELVDVVRRFMK